MISVNNCHGCGIKSTVFCNMYFDVMLKNLKIPLKTIKINSWYLASLLLL